MMAEDNPSAETQNPGDPHGIWDVVVIGGGPAGLSAALAGHAEGAQVLVLERESAAGGILRQCIHNGFGQVLFKEDMPGPRFAEQFVRQCRAAAIQVLVGTMVIAVESSQYLLGDVADARFRLTVSGGTVGFATVRSRSLVLAMGCRERTRSQIQLPGDRGAGIYTAGTVQRMVNLDGLMPGREFVILGSGDIGMIMARRLTLEGAQVKRVLELQPWLTGLRRNYVQCLQDFDIPLSLSTTVTRVIGRKRVQAVETSAGETISCDTLLLSVGLIPENELTRSLGAAIDPLTQGPVVDQDGATSIPGLFAAGNVVGIYDLADWVSLAGSRAGKAAALAALGRSQSGHASPRSFIIAAGQGVRSVLPQRLQFVPDVPTNANERPRIDFRVSAPMEQTVTVILSRLNPAELAVSNGDSSPLRQARISYARPAEMLTLSPQWSDFSDPSLPDRLWVHVMGES